MTPTLFKASLLALALVSSAQAHRTWLLPTNAHVSGKTSLVSVDAVASEEMFEFEHALALGTLVVVSPQGKLQTPVATYTAKHRNSLDVQLDQPGTYRISNLGGAINASYKLGSETKRFRGSLEDLKKALPAGASDLRVTRALMRSETFVSKDTAAVPAFVPANEGLELQPLTTVTDLSDGDTVRLRLLLDGKPLADAPLTLLKGGNRHRYKLGEVTLKTDASGEVAITWAEAGRYWLGAGHEVGPNGGGTLDAPLKRYRYSATFDVLPK